MHTVDDKKIGESYSSMTQKFEPIWSISTGTLSARDDSLIVLTSLEVPLKGM
jgi:hypothetical protein